MRITWLSFQRLALRCQSARLNVSRARILVFLKINGIKNFFAQYGNTVVFDSEMETGMDGVEAAHKHCASHDCLTRHIFRSHFVHRLDDSFFEISVLAMICTPASRGMVARTSRHLSRGVASKAVIQQLSKLLTWWRPRLLIMHWNLSAVYGLSRLMGKMIPAASISLVTKSAEDILKSWVCGMSALHPSCPRASRPDMGVFNCSSLFTICVW